MQIETKSLAEVPSPPPGGDRGKPMSQRTGDMRSQPLTIKNVAKAYGQLKVLDDVNLDVGSGEFLTLLGASGSGKTTLLMVIAGFARPDSGAVMVGGTDIVRTPAHKRNMGMVFQSYALFPHMNVAANVGYPLRLRGVGRVEIADRVARALDLVQLGHLGERRIDQLSGGQRQRIALARAIVFEPRILLMDEPLSALDKKLREHMQIEIRRLHEKLGMTTIYVTHDQREALTMSDRIAIMDRGRIVQIDEPRRLYERPASRFVADFIGESSFLPIIVEAGIARFGDLVLKTGGRLDTAPRQLLVLRPEKLEILGSEQAPGLNVLSGILTELIYQGESFLCQIALGEGHTVVVRGPTRRDTLAGLPELGGSMRLGLHPEDTVLVPDA